MSRNVARTTSHTTSANGHVYGGTSKLTDNKCRYMTYVLLPVFKFMAPSVAPTTCIMQSVDSPHKPLP